MKAMRSNADNIFQFISDENATPAVTPATPPSDADLLDAYSQAVIGVNRSVGPAVVSVQAPPRQQGGSGSGVIISPDGFVLTNSHVVHGRDKLMVVTSEGDRLQADVAGDDPATDLAVLRVHS